MTNKKYLTVTILCAVVIGFFYLGIELVVSQWITNQNGKTLLTIDLKIAEQELLLGTIADLARRTEADAITNRIIVDCVTDERKRFDTLLDALSVQITTPELKELDILFYKCGNFYSDRKAVMSARLHREVEVYNDFVSLRAGLISSVDVVLQERGSLWVKLSESELVFSDYFGTLVKLQGDIISALLVGESRNSESITATLDEVTATRVQMTILSRQIEEYRNSIQSL